MLHVNSHLIQHGEGVLLSKYLNKEEEITFFDIL